MTISCCLKLTWTVSPRVFLAAFFSGTLTVVPSTIFSIPCCTPSPSTRGGLCRCYHKKRNEGRIAELSNLWMRVLSKFYLPHPSADGCQGRLQFCQPEIINIHSNSMMMDRYDRNMNGSYEESEKIDDLIKEDDALLRLLHIKVGILGREL